MITEKYGTFRQLLSTELQKKPENNIVQIKGVLNDPGGGHSGAQNILLRRQILRVSDTSQVRQEAATFKLMFPFIFHIPITRTEVFWMKPLLCLN